MAELLHTSDTRLVAGLMSGTSLDGIDAVVAHLSGSGRGLRFEVRGFVHTPYPEALRALLLRNSAPETSSVAELSQLNVRLAHAYAEAVRRAADAAGVSLDEIDLVGAHGQTVYHIPDPTDCAGLPTTSTLQIGDPSVLANLLGRPVVGDFRLADMALGGQGAPLVPYLDYIHFTDDGETRGLLNLGGIANLTLLPRGAAPSDVRAFDTGPANIVADALTQHFYGESFDRDGAHAARGTIRNDLLTALLDEPYFAVPPPKSTGRELFSKTYVDRLLDRTDGLPPDDVLATATMLSAASIYQAYARFIRPHHTLDVVIASGGGRHNAFLMQKLADAFAPIPVRPIDDYGIDADAKEALCFAIFAHETLNGVPANLPSVTGASRPALLGKICLPG